MSKALHPELSEESKASLATLKRARMVMQGQIAHEPYTAGPPGQSLQEQAAAAARNATHTHGQIPAAAAAAPSGYYYYAGAAAPDDIDKVLAASLSNTNAPMPPASYPAPAEGHYADVSSGLIPPTHELYGDVPAGTTADDARR